MTTKRWVAIGIAVTLFVFSLALPKRQTETDIAALIPEESVIESVLEERSGASKIVKLTIDGAILDQDSESLFASETYNHTFFIEQLKMIQKDDSVKGIFLEINSPGGGVYESAEIARLINEIQIEQEIPMYVSMKSLAASGGYYVAASADKIYATADTMTGSIGVIMSGLNFSGLLEKMGVEDTTVKSGEMKDVGSSTRPWTEEDYKVMQTMIDSSYDRFVKVVVDGRGMDEKKVREIADGRIYDGAQAVENGLVDELGYPDEVLAALRTEQGLEKADLIEYELNASYYMGGFPFNLLTAFTNQEGMTSKSPTPTVEGLAIESDETPRMMYIYGGEQNGL